MTVSTDRSSKHGIRAVAAQAGVSIATVSRALNDKDDVSVETRERVRRAARDLRYTVDPSARALGSHGAALFSCRPALARRSLLSPAHDAPPGKSAHLTRADAGFFRLLPYVGSKRLIVADFS